MEIFINFFIFYLFFGILLIRSADPSHGGIRIRNKRIKNCQEDEDADDDNIISYSELAGNTDTFRISGVDSFNQILFDSKNYQVIFGARDHLVRLSLVGLQLLESAEWSSNRSTITSCTMKGQSPTKCHNYLTVLQSRGKKLFVCGTNAFSPVCSWRRLTSINNIDSWESGIGRSSFDPARPVTSLMTSDGSFFVGTSLDFSGHDGAFVRSRGPMGPRGPMGWLRTPKSHPMWLSEPKFVSSFSADHFVYFSFNEVAVEARNCGKRIYPRIGRICKGDTGGSVILKNNWTTFLKARLNCSLSGQSSVPFHYDFLESSVFLPGEQVFFGLFTAGMGGLEGSAICAFPMATINESFDGSFRYQPDPSSLWKSATVADTSHFRCGGDNRNHSSNDRHEESLMADKYQLMDMAVRPLADKPLFTIDYGRMTHIAVDVVATRQSGPVYVVFVATTSGQIQKWSVLMRHNFMTNTDESVVHGPPESADPTTCLLSTYEPFPPQNNSTTSSKILSMKFLKETTSLYLGTDTMAIRLAVNRCERYSTRHLCLATRDPYCGWDSNTLHCTGPPGGDPLTPGWIQHVIGCPSRKEPVDGGWSQWSEWAVCLQGGSKDECLCRHRNCDAPRPLKGGTPCSGHDTEVMNCTIHGGWTPWSAWSACSSSCGFAVKTRRRTCSNPEPVNGGRVCVGSQTAEMYCHGLPKCPRINWSDLVVDGGWGQWEPWTKCSTECGKGTRRRQRHCTQPQHGGVECQCTQPQHGGRLFRSCDTEMEECVGMNCSSLIDWSTWTPWMVSQSGVRVTSREVSQRRYRMECHVEVTPVGDLTLASGSLSFEDRKCSTDGCSEPSGQRSYKPSDHRSYKPSDHRSYKPSDHRSYKPSDDRRLESSDQMGWLGWSDWSGCSAPCGGGTQQRTRICLGRCPGQKTEGRSCNVYKCEGTWSCWGEWTTCSTSCGPGVQERWRGCVTPHDLGAPAEGCQGHATQFRSCYLGSCEVLVAEMRLPQPSNHSHSHNCVSVETFAGSCLGCLFLGAAFGVAVYILFKTDWLKNSRKQIPKTPTSSSHYKENSSPYKTDSSHYIKAKPNLYISVPGADPKESPYISQYSSSQGLGGPNTPSATLKRGLNAFKSAVGASTPLPLKNFDSATLKRSSHGSHANSHIRADLDSDQIFFS